MPDTRTPYVAVTFMPEAWESFFTTVYKLSGFTARVTTIDGDEQVVVLVSGDEEAETGNAIRVRQADRFGAPVGEVFTLRVKEVEIL